MSFGRKSAAPVVVTALLGVALSAGLGVLIRHQQLQLFRREVQANAENRFAAIRRQADADLFMLMSVTGMLESPQTMTRERFAQVARAAQGPDRSHIIAWLPRITHDERAKFERALAQAKAAPPFVKERIPNGVQPAPVRAHYYPVLYSVPEESKSTLGLNIESFPDARIAMRQAIADRAPAGTGPIRFQGDRHHARVAVFGPVWWNGNMDGPPTGFLAVGIRTDQIIERALAYLQPVGMHISLWDETDERDRKLLYRHTTRKVDGDVKTRLTAEPVSRTLKFANRTWRIVCEPVMARPSLVYPVAASGAGLLITFLLMRWIRHYTGKTELIEAVVRDRTEELRREVAERRRTEAQLGVARDEALEASRLKSEFLANVSHEFRTPLNGIVGTTEMLINTRIDNEQREGLSIIREGANSLLHLISDVLDASRLEHGGLRLEVSEFAPESVIETALDIVAERAHRKGLDIAGWVDAPAGLKVRGDAYRVRQVLLNLITNAVKFTNQGSIVVRAWRKADAPETWHFEVSDTGIGIDPESQKLLFQRFVQLDGTTTRQVGGTGLGLAISRQIVELMGGQICVKSSPGRGSTFYFELPLAVAAEPPLGKNIASSGIRIVVDAAEATTAALKAWLGPAIVNSVRTPGEDPRCFLIASSDSPLYSAWSGPRIQLRRLTDPPSEIAPNTRLLTCPVHRARVLDLLEGLQSPAQQSKQPDTVSHPKGKVLLVEDNPVNRRVALWMLQKLGYTSTFAADGIEALDAMRSEEFDAVLMDCQMPRMDGYEATRAIRELPGRAAATPVIALTANAMQGDRDLCIAAGMDDYVPKPLDMNTLKTCLERWAKTSKPAPEDAPNPDAVRFLAS